MTSRQDSREIMRHSIMGPLPDTDFADQTIANLKVISMLQKGCKLRVRKGQLCVDAGGYLQSLRRFLSNDSRDLTMMHVRQTVANALRLAKNDPQSKFGKRLLEEFRSATAGLQNLKAAYSGDSVVLAHIDVMLERIESAMTDMSERK